MPAQRLSSAEFPFRLWTHQRAAIRAYDSCPDLTRCYLTLPPGAGKTLIGAEIARRAGRRIVVLAPNAAVQGQWVQLWYLLGTDTVSVAEDLQLTADVTVLTYQNIGISQDDIISQDDNSLASAPRPHPTAADFLRRLTSGPPFTLILDDADHLAAEWRETLENVLTELTSQNRRDDWRAPIIIALTSTPRDRLAPDQAQLIERFFGPQLFSVSTPALVREQALAPFRALVRFANPTEAERKFLRQSSKRWRELMPHLADPDFASISFVEFLNDQWVHPKASLQDGPMSLRGSSSWDSVERAHPEIARALLRVHFDSQLVDLPQGARLREDHRQPPSLEDWAALVSDYGRRALVPSTSDRDTRAWEQLRTALGSVGWELTRDGDRRGQSPVDDVLMRSAVKADTAATILQHEFAVRGPDMRAAIITDYERSDSTPATQVPESLSRIAGSAIEALVQTDHVLPQMRPVLVTSGIVAGSPETITQLVDFVANGNPELADGLTATPVPEAVGMVSLSGPGWGPRIWIPMVTGWFLAGGNRVLVGTRDLLGEGWDAACLNVLIDLTTTTSSTATVQLRGRLLRKDPADPLKAANVWSVVVVSDDHPRGDLDYRRFAKKHEGLHGVDATGLVVTGPAQVDPYCDPFSPPSPKIRTAVNIRMMNAATRTAELPMLWGVDQPYENVDVPIVQVRSCEGGSLQLDVPQAAIRPWSRTRGLVPATGAAVGAALPIIAAASPSQALVWASIGGVTGWGADAGSRWAARRRTVDRATPGDTLLAIGQAVAQGLHLDPSLVDVAPDGDGIWRILYQSHEEPDRQDARNPRSTRLGTPDDREQWSFARAMEQVLSPIGWPRYLISRQLPRKKAEMWHSVPDCLGKDPHSADRFLSAWVKYVSGARLLPADGPEGAGVLASIHGFDLGDTCAGVRTEWR